MTAIEAMLQEPAAQAIGRALVQFVWQGAIIGVATAVILALLRRSAADIRYVVATIAMSLMLTVPVVSVLQSIGRETPRGVASTVEASEPVASSASYVSPDHALGGPGITTPAADGPQRTPARPRWLPAFVGAWLVGVSLLTLRLFSGWVIVQRLKFRGAMRVGRSVEVMAARLMRNLHIARPIRFLESPLIDVPTVIGWVKPVVLLPASTLAGLTPNQLEAVLAHELAHIRRHDYLVNLLQTVVETLLFYHPAVWWLSRRIRIERENCCDDLAVTLCGDPVAYAAALAEIEGMRGAPGQLALAASGGSLLQRIRRVLGAPSHPGRAPGWLAAGLAILVIATVAAAALGRQILVAESASERRLSARARASELTPQSLPLLEHPRGAAHPERAEAEALEASAKTLERDAARTREKAIRHCIEEIQKELPVQLRGPGHALRGPCQAVLGLRDRMRKGDAIGDIAHEISAVVPAVAEAVAEPIEQVAEAIAEASVETVARVEPVITDFSRTFETELSRAVERVRRAAQTSSRSARGQRSGNFTWSDDGEKLEVSYRGDIEFTDDDKDVRSISPGGWLRIRHEGNSDRSLEFSADRDGRIERRFRVRGSDRPYEPDGRKWAAEMLPRFIRQSGINAAARVRRIHRTGGIPGIVAEIALIEGDWAQRVYYSELLKLPSIAPRDVQQALTQAGQDIGSDFELASLLISADDLVKDDSTRKAYFDAARTIGSDFEMRRVFSAALDSGPVAPVLLAGMLEASTAIGSDFEAASLLVQIAQLQPVDGVIRVPFFRALDTIDSAFERRRVLAAVTKRTELPADVQASVLESAASIGSDFECASVLLEFAQQHSVEGAARAPFFKAASTIQSAFERGRVLQAVAKRADASHDTVLSVIRSAQGMNGGFEQAQVLLAVAGAHQLTREGRDAYIDASEHLGNHEQGRVLAALVKNERK